MFLPILFAVTLSATEPAAVPPASEATIDAFVAALPAAKPDSDPGQSLDQDRLDRLVTLNPGREAEARAAFDAAEQCEETAKKKAVTDTLRASARRLGDAKLKLLTEFYNGSDHAVFAAFSARIPDKLSEAEKAEFDRIRAKYPLEDYEASLRESEKAMWEPDGLMGDLFDCYEVFEADVEKRGLKS